eukprot:TRINITY_DN651_c0_g1_i16.p1 TRINITY_DN651_c0_g1~~TRINITY_DN651_c0_g1_i16.p1  ORF type:complete len:160 (-),score=1.55 TRINITY_DN651_c0_g1_i16:500-979(-)
MRMPNVKSNWVHPGASGQRSGTPENYNCSVGYEWSGWSTCSKACGGGVQSRFYYNLNAINCTMSKDTRPCNTQPCPAGTPAATKACQVSDWASSCVGCSEQSVRFVTQSGTGCHLALQRVAGCCTGGGEDVTNTVSYLCLGGCAHGRFITEVDLSDEVF